MKSTLKKMMGIALSLLLGVSTVLAAVGCKGPSLPGNYTEEVDTNRTQLYVYNYDGGFGSEWLSKVKQRYEELHANDVYEPGTGKRGIQIMMNNTKNGVTSETIKSGQDDEVYFIENMYYYSLRYDGALMDITDAVSGENPYEPAKTIESKLTAEQQNFYGIKGAREDGKTQYLGVPHYFGTYGLVYNKDLFDEKGYYFLDGYDENSNLEDKFVYYDTDKKTAGPNGQYGDDDDGLPTTYQEFYWLLEYISRMNSQTALSWTGQYYTQYLGFLLNSLVADYEGLDQMMLNFTFDGTATDLGSITGGSFAEDANDLQITEENGWELKRQSGVYYALDFIENLVDTEMYHNSNAFTDSYSHLDNQQDFLMSGVDGVTTPIAMTVDGMWWQSESSQVFSSMASRYGDQYSMENRNLRWMPLPKANKEKAAEAAEKIANGRNGYTVTDSLYSLCCVSSGIEDWKLPIAIDFIQFCNTDESLIEFTTTTNTVKALTYEIDETVLEQLSPYGRSLIEYIQNADIVYPYSQAELYINNSSMFRADEYYRATVNGATKNYPAQAFHVDGISAEDYFTGLATYYKSSWNTLA